MLLFQHLIFREQSNLFLLTVVVIKAIIKSVLLLVEPHI